MARAVRIHRYGGPEQLRCEAAPAAVPARGEVVLRQTAIGVNFIDVYHRTGLYPLPALPHGIGQEAVGVVAAVGPGVTGWSVGDRVGYPIGGTPGAYADERAVPAWRLVALPRGLDDPTAASLLLKGLTAEMLVRRVHRIGPKQRVLVHAAAGGVGLLLCQWLRHLGAFVIGTVGSDAKAEVAAAHGCHLPVVYTRDDFVAAVAAATKGKGVDVVYDSVGEATLRGSLQCVRRRGLVVSFGNASGVPAPVAVRELLLGGSLFLTRPSLGDYIGTASELKRAAAALFTVVQQGAIAPPAPTVLRLDEAAEAHRRLEARATTGPLVLLH